MECKSFLENLELIPWTEAQNDRDEKFLQRSYSYFIRKDLEEYIPLFKSSAIEMGNVWSVKENL